LSRPRAEQSATELSSKKQTNQNCQWEQDPKVDQHLVKSVRLENWALAAVLLTQKGGGECTAVRKSTGYPPDMKKHYVPSGAMAIEMETAKSAPKAIPSASCLPIRMLDLLMVWEESTAQFNQSDPRQRIRCRQAIPHPTAGDREATQQPGTGTAGHCVGTAIWSAPPLAVVF
jgi:hypothetical protein